MPEFHEYANIFPMLQGASLDALRDDIDKHGIREPIVFFDDVILDGRNRYICANDLGIEYPRVDFDGTNPLAFVISHNLHRRHLSESQRAMVAAKIANMPAHRPDKAANLPTSTQSDAADMLNVSERSVRTAKKVERQAAPELVELVESGNLSVTAAATVSELPKEKQVEIVAKGEKEILKIAKDIRAAKAVKNREVRLDNLAKIALGNTELDTELKYPVIYADPPWHYENAPMGDANRSIENHYPTMYLEDICAMPVSELATDDAILYMWATAPKLAECMQVIEAWGFVYRTNMIWDKVNIGMGYYARNQHELLLICKRGNIPTPQAGTQPASVYSEKRGKHSAKPHFYYEMIEAAYPQLPKIELFCRTPRNGWAVHGNQSQAKI